MWDIISDEKLEKTENIYEEKLDYIIFDYADIIFKCVYIFIIIYFTYLHTSFVFQSFM